MYSQSYCSEFIILFACQHEIIIEPCHKHQICILSFCIKFIFCLVISLFSFCFRQVNAIILLTICASGRATSPPSTKVKRQYIAQPASIPYYPRNSEANAQTLRQVDQKDANGQFNYEYVKAKIS